MAMKTTVTGRHIEITPALRAHVEERMEHLSRYTGRPTQASVVLTVEKYRHHAEVTLNVDGVVIQAKGETSEMYASIDQASDKIERQLKKHKGRQQRRRTRPAAKPATDGVVELPIDTTTSLPRERPALKTMSPEQAAVLLNGDETPLVVFRREGTDDVNVVYRKTDGSVAWIDPAP